MMLALLVCCLGSVHAERMIQTAAILPKVLKPSEGLEEHGQLARLLAEVVAVSGIPMRRTGRCTVCIVRLL